MTVVVLFYDIIQSDGLRYFHNDLLQAFQNFEKTLKAFFLKTESLTIFIKFFSKYTIFYMSPSFMSSNTQIGSNDQPVKC